MTEKTADPNAVAAREEGGQQQPEQGAYLRPPVDIFEDAEGIVLLADMPGVGKEQLDLQVSHDSLTIVGELAIEMPQDMEALYADVRATRYHRSFTLSSELDTDAIDAALKDGVLRVRIPKRAETRPRRIEVQVA